LRWAKQPWLSDSIQQQVEGLRELLRGEWLSQLCVESVANNTPVTLESEEGQKFTLSAGTADLVDKGLRLKDVRLQRIGGDPKRPYYFTAPLAVVNTRRTLDQRMKVELRLEETTGEPVREHNPRSSNYEEGRAMVSYTPETRFEIPDEVRQRVAALSDADLLNPNVTVPISAARELVREKLIANAQEAQRKFASAIHFRLGYASSILVTALMAAALGAMFRGSAALAAFALGCVPMFASLILMVMGQQLGGKEGKEFMSPLLTWGGLAAIAIADMIILRVGVRR